MKIRVDSKPGTVPTRYLMYVPDTSLELFRSSEYSTLRTRMP